MINDQSIYKSNPNQFVGLYLPSVTNDLSIMMRVMCKSAVKNVINSGIWKFDKKGENLLF